jgi:hypothetical protein
LEGVGRREDPGRQRDRRRGEAMVVAAAVQALVCRPAIRPKGASTGEQAKIRSVWY